LGAGLAVGARVRGSMAAVPLGDGLASSLRAIALRGPSGTELAAVDVDAELKGLHFLIMTRAVCIQTAGVDGAESPTVTSFIPATNRSEA
jgi:hypothetical protein